MKTINTLYKEQLAIEIEKIEEGKSLIKGLFGPKPQAWTLFMFIHFLVAFAFIIFSIMAYSRWSLQKSVFFPITMMIILPLVWVLLYALGRLGKSTGKKQMNELKQFMNTALSKLK